MRRRSQASSSDLDLSRSSQFNPPSPVSHVRLSSAPENGPVVGISSRTAGGKCNGSREASVSVGRKAKNASLTLQRCFY